MKASVVRAIAIAVLAAAVAGAIVYGLIDRNPPPVAKEAARPAQPPVGLPARPMPAAQQPPPDAADELVDEPDLELVAPDQRRNPRMPAKAGAAGDRRRPSPNPGVADVQPAKIETPVPPVSPTPAPPPVAPAPPPATPPPVIADERPAPPAKAPAPTPPPEEPKKPKNSNPVPVGF